jgi:predicted small metal-binding protein
MTKVLRCRDVGVDCDFEAKGETAEEIMAQAAKHAKEAHGMDQIPPEVVEQCQKAIRDL